MHMRIVFLVFVTIFCELSPAIAESKPRVCVLLPTQREETWQNDRNHFLEEGQRRKEVELYLDISSNRTEEQSAQLDRLVANSCHYLVIAPHDHEAMCQQLKKYPNLYVIAYDRWLNCPPVKIFIGYDTLHAGKVQGRFLSQTVKQGNLVVLKGPKTDRNAQDYFDGAMSYLSPQIKACHYQVILLREIEDWSPAQAQKAMFEAWSLANGNIAGVLSPNDALASGVIEALELLNAPHRVPVTGMDGEKDAINRVQKGSQAMTLIKDKKVAVQKVFELIEMIESGQTIDHLPLIQKQGHEFSVVLLRHRYIEFKP